MTITIVKGLAGKVGHSGAGSSANTSNGAHTEAATSTAAQSAIATTDAAVTNIRSNRSGATGKRIEDSREARKVADEVADSVLERSEEALAAHGEVPGASVRSPF